LFFTVNFNPLQKEPAKVRIIFYLNNYLLKLLLIAMEKLAKFSAIQVEKVKKIIY